MWPHPKARTGQNGGTQVVQTSSAVIYAGPGRHRQVQMSSSSEDDSSREGGLRTPQKQTEQARRTLGSLDDLVSRTSPKFQPQSVLHGVSAVVKVDDEERVVARRNRVVLAWCPWGSGVCRHGVEGVAGVWPAARHGPACPCASRP